jgi:hypothetical protein
VGAFSLEPVWCLFPPREHRYDRLSRKRGKDFPPFGDGPPGHPHAKARVAGSEHPGLPIGAHVSAPAILVAREVFLRGGSQGRVPFPSPRTTAVPRRACPTLKMYLSRLQRRECVRSSAYCCGPEEEPLSPALLRGRRDSLFGPQSEMAKQCLHPAHQASRQMFC